MLSKTSVGLPLHPYGEQGADSIRLGFNWAKRCPEKHLEALAATTKSRVIAAQSADSMAQLLLEATGMIEDEPMTSTAAVLTAAHDSDAEVAQALIVCKQTAAAEAANVQKYKEAVAKHVDVLENCQKALRANYRAGRRAAQIYTLGSDRQVHGLVRCCAFLVPSGQHHA